MRLVGSMPHAVMKKFGCLTKGQGLQSRKVRAKSQRVKEKHSQRTESHKNRIMTEWIILLMEEILHQLRLVGFPMIYSFFHQVVIWDFLHQQLPGAKSSRLECRWSSRSNLLNVELVREIYCITNHQCLIICTYKVRIFVYIHIQNTL